MWSVCVCQGLSEKKKEFVAQIREVQKKIKE